MLSSAHRNIEQRCVRAWKKLCILQENTYYLFTLALISNVILSPPNVLEVLLEFHFVREIWFWKVVACIERGTVFRLPENGASKLGKSRGAIYGFREISALLMNSGLQWRFAKWLGLFRTQILVGRSKKLVNFYRFYSNFQYSHTI
jgi:hypothetical protein